ncbi:type 2 lanthipeptide synthetase LanM family protein [Archangium lansingense]|uniref:type 2 lanthipeptide synthetase LanM family protein n=1 Tax=Archangium lansingense TaxID=2995310 RepID=UPI003B808740
MTESSFGSAAWFRAVWLRERQQGLGKAAGGGSAEEVQRLLEPWRAKEPFTSEIPFERRLEAEGLTEAQLGALLTEPLEELKLRLGGQLPWLTALQEAFSQPVSSEPFPVPKNLQGVATVGFLEWVRPLIERGRARVRAHIQEVARAHSHLLFAPETLETLLFAGLPVRLLDRINRTLVLEMNVARLRGQLKGETGAERFRSFVELLREPKFALGLLEEYPVLARLCVEAVERWVETSVELATRLAADGPALRETLLPADPGLLTEFSGQAGDQHHNGRAVHMLTFSSGIKLVYKPRSFGVDQRFHELLAWLGERGELPPFRQLRMLARDGYGWCEFVDARPCESEEGVKRFYQRMGALLCLFHHVGGMDMHFENLIAEGEHPVVVDLETLFHPQISARMSFPSREEQLFIRIIDYSVSRISMLPLRAWATEQNEGVDVGGMGSPEGKLTPHEVPHWEATGEDTMRQYRKRIVMNGARNMPTVRGEPVQPGRYMESLCAGFEQMYRLLQRERDALLAPEGPVRRFIPVEIRVLLRSTQIYYKLLQESYHPDLLRDGLARERYFDNLWMGMRRRPFLASVATEERAALHRGDIPRFSTRPDSTDLDSGPGGMFPGALWSTGLAVCEQRLHGMGEADLERHHWWIRSSLVSSLPELPPEPAPPPRREPVPVEPTRLMAAARSVGDRLLTLASSDEGMLGWMGLRQDDFQSWSFSPLTLDLYGGMSGVALFLAQLGQLSGEERFTRVARNASDTLRRVAERSRTRMKVLGGFEGWGGVIYMMTHLGVLLDEPALLAEAESHVEPLLPFIAQDRNLDIIAGAAGCIGGLLALHHTTGSTRALAAAVSCGEHLLATRQPQAQGAGWMTTVPSTQPLSGFSHGASGMAWALLELATASGEQRFAEAAQEALAYERTLFNPGQLNWKDTRTSSQSVHAWCYGAPGIGLARARMLRHLDAPQLREELRAAVAGTLKRGFGHNDSLCHGDLGNLEVLVSAQAAGEAPDETGAFIQATLEALLARAGQRDWRCATPLGVETPGLMIGLAGIGWGLLRFAAPGRIPSVLMLEPPAAQDRMIR